LAAERDLAALPVLPLISATMRHAPWIFPELAGKRWARADLDALARAQFPDTHRANPLNDPWVCDFWIKSVADRLGADHTWGGWLENRAHLWRGHYLPPEGSIHLGVDLNVPPGTVVLTPLAGEVLHAVPCRALGGGWGGWFVLRADEPRCGAEYLLFGHLAHAGLPEQGTLLAAGAPVGRVGLPHENGGWYPHVHVQAMSAEAWNLVRHDLDTLLDGYGPAQAGLAELFPNPAPLMGLPRGGATA
jgi:murein DD-endopeptidase MepM/ murein hydrolase activator NlpD